MLIFYCDKFNVNSDWLLAENVTTNTCGIKRQPLDMNGKDLPLDHVVFCKCNMLRSLCQCHHANFVSKKSSFYCQCLINALTLSNKCKVILVVRCKCFIFDWYNVLFNFLMNNKCKMLNFKLLDDNCSKRRRVVQARQKSKAQIL